MKVVVDIPNWLYHTTAKTVGRRKQMSFAKDYENVQGLANAVYQSFKVRK